MAVPMRDLLKSRPVQPIETDNTFQLMDDETIVENILLAYLLLGNWKQAHEAVVEMLLYLPGTLKALEYNRKQKKVPTKPRPSYRPLIDKHSVSRSLLLGVIEDVQTKNEKRGKPADEHYWLRCLAQKLVAIALNHSSFWTAVIMTQVVTSFTADQTLAIFEEVAPRRARDKYPDEVSTVKASIISMLAARFHSLKMRKEGSAFRFISANTTKQQNEMFFELLLRILPPMPENAHGPQSGMSAEGIEEWKRMKRLFTLSSLNGLTSSIDGPAFQERLILPLIPNLLGDFDPEPTDNPPKGGRRALPNRSKCNVARIKRAIAANSGRRQGRRPRSLAILVDGAIRGDIDRFKRTCAVKLGAHATVIKLVATYDNLRTVPLAAYLLTYDEPKTETWIVKVQGLGRLECELRFRADNTVSARFKLLEGKAAMSHEPVHPKPGDDATVTARARSISLTHREEPGPLSLATGAPPVIDPCLRKPPQSATAHDEKTGILRYGSIYRGTMLLHEAGHPRNPVISRAVRFSADLVLLSHPDSRSTV